MSSLLRTCADCPCDSNGGYKHVVSAVRWFGGEHPYGYLECSDQDESWWTGGASNIPYSPLPPDHKYLGNTLEVIWDQRDHRTVLCGPYLREDNDYVFHFRWSRDAHTNRFSGAGSISEIVTWDDNYVDSVTPGNSFETHLTGQDALAKFLTMFPPYTTLDAKCGHIQPENPLPGSDAYWSEIVREADDTSIRVGLELDVDQTTHSACTGDLGEPFTDDDRLIKTGAFTSLNTLYDKFTSAELYAYGIQLLAIWDLGDDTHYPWRTACSGEGYHYGALVTFDYGGNLFGVPGAMIGGPYSGETWAVGPHALTGYSAEGMSGGSVWFNNQENVWGYTGDYLVCGKWAEKKVTLPSHNYARPCGPGDAATLCWPGIPDPCVDPCNNTTSTGDYTTLERAWAKRLYEEAVRTGGSVPLLWDNTCTQENAASGTVLYCSPNAEDFGATPTEQRGTFPASASPVGDDKYGYLWQFHVRQVMPDPLLSCAALYPSPPPLFEESRCSVPGGCPGLPAGSYFYCTDSLDSTCGYQDNYGLQCPPL